MPVVELSYSRLQRLAGAPRKKIASRLPYLGLDIESEDGDSVRIEYSPNRPDYSTEYGVAMGLQGLLGVRTGAVPLRVKKSDYSITARPEVSALRPFVTAMAACGGRVTDSMIKQLMNLQEDLHAGLGRGRAKASVGIHDCDKIRFPLQYGVASRDHRFAPLGSKKEMTVSEILQDTQVGCAYSHILGPGKSVPLLSDGAGRTVSLPPVINSALTTVTPGTRNILVEVTGTSKGIIEDVLSIVCVTLQAAGFGLQSVRVSGAKNSTPRLGTRKMSVPLSLINRTLGTELSARQAVSALKKSRLDASGSSIIRCVIPAHRFDIFGPMDLVEEAALGLGIDTLEPALSPSQAIGSRDAGLELLGRTSLLMTGLGYTEALNSSLSSESALCHTMGRDPSAAISVADSKSGGSVLRDSLLPGLLGCLSGNIHEPYPQRLFETGTVFGKNASEEAALGCVSAHDGSSYTEAKSSLQALCCALDIRCETRAADVPGMEPGHAARIFLDGKASGVIGEVSKKALGRLKLRVPVSAFEMNLQMPG